MFHKLKDTKYNKNISVVNGFGEPTLIVDGLVESGHILTHIWKTGINYHLPSDYVPKKVLLLGLGGGSNAIFVHKKYPDAKITVVEIDSFMVDLANKYYKLNKKVPQLDIVIADALDFVNKLSLNDPQSMIYDLVLVDCFEGKWIPKKLENLEFIQKIYNHSNYLLINRIWYHEHHSGTVRFMNSLSTKFVFSKVHTSTNVILSLL